MKHWIACPIILVLIFSQFGCVRVCRNTLNHYGVYDHYFEDINKVIVAPSGDVALGGKHVHYRLDPDYTKNNIVRVATKTSPGWVIGPASNFKTMVRHRMLEIEKSNRMGIKEEPKVLPMVGLHLEHARGTWDKSVLGEDLHYDPWDSLIDKKGGIYPDTALLPDIFKGGVMYDVREKPMNYDYNGKSLSLVFVKSNGEVARRKVRWWAPLVYPFAKVTDTALSLALIGWTIPVIPLSIVGDGMLKIPAQEFLWPAPFVNTWRKTKGMPPLKPEHFFGR